MVTASFWNSQLFAALIGVVGMVLTAYITHLLTKKNERKKRIEDDVFKLREKNAELNKTIEEYEAIEQSPTGDFIIMKKTGQAICPVCWGKSRTQIPIYQNEAGRYICGNCNSSGVYNHKMVKRLEYEQECANREIQDFFSNEYDIYK